MQNIYQKGIIEFRNEAEAVFLSFASAMKRNTVSYKNMSAEVCMSRHKLYEIFKNPGMEWRGKPFWSWNGELREDEVRRQINVMKQMGLGGFFMHSRAGLITEYLGEEWFDLINAGADEGERIGMEAWLYDEDRWPSGSAGGMVTSDPRYRMKSLVITEQSPDTFARDDSMRYVFLARLDGIDLWRYTALEREADIKAALTAFEKETASDPGTIRILSFSVVPDSPSSNYNGNTYIDTMSRAAVNRFIEMTHERYKARCGDRFGKSIKGIFTDEPHRGHAMDDCTESNGIKRCSMCWTDDFFDEFESRYGYRADTILPELFYRPKGERFAPVKRDWFDLADNLFLERFAMQIYDWCNANNIAFTGHVLHEDSLSNQSAPHGSLMRFYEYMDIPGVDVLTEHNRCYWIVKQLASVARQLGKKQMLSELYGCTGWQFDFKSHKAVGDWQALFGINLRCHHLSWYTMEGESKRDYPASILHQSPWYPYYNDIECYFARFGAFMAEGSPVCDVLVLNPIESIWAQTYIGWADWIYPKDDAADINRLEDNYERLFHMLTGNHIDFDYGEEQMMEKYASVFRDKNGKALLKVGQMFYRVVVISGMETIRPTTLKLLTDFAEAGGKIIFAGEVPVCVNACRDDAPAVFARKYGICVSFEENALAAAVRESSFAPVFIASEDGTPAGNVFIQMRDFGDSIGFVLLNTDRDNPTSDLTVSIRNIPYKAAECWDMETGARYAAELICSGDICTLRTTLEAAGTAAFVLTDTADTALLPISEKTQLIDKLKVDGEFDYECNEPNVCVLDFARFSLNGGEWSEEQEILRIDSMVRDAVGLEHRGGEMLQPWFARKTDKAVYGKVLLEYTFDIETMPSGDLILAGERPGQMHYAINGIPLSSDDVHNFWIDDCFKKMSIPVSLLKPGRNVITAETDFMRTTNLEALYLIGDFGVSLCGKLCILTDRPDKLRFGNIDTAAMPFYTGELTYLITPDRYSSMNCSDGERVTLTSDAFFGSLIRIQADGMKELHLFRDPFEADVTDAVRNGKTLRVTVVGTRRNLFGPLHFAPRFYGACGPGCFVTEGDDWTDDYALTDSGIHGITLKKYRVCNK